MKLSRFINIVAAASMVLAALGFSYAPVVAQSEEPPLPGYPFIPGEVVIGFTPGKTITSYRTQAFALASSLKGEVVRQNGGVALLSVSDSADVEAIAAQLSHTQGVAFAEPNYVYSIPEQTQASSRHQTGGTTTVTRNTGEGKEPLQVPVEALRAMKTKRNGRIQSTYPNDPQLWWNDGWWVVGGDIVSPNTTASAGVCVIDSGTDYLHPDLGTNIVKGWDFVNNDADPMDDNGHGTHVAGVIAAKKNNGEGIVGISTGKVVAVKALNAQGWGSNYNVASAINYCANRTDVKVISMSLGGGASTAVYNAVNYAVNTKGKLVVAAAGNSNTDLKSYPGGYAPDFPNKVLAVGASGVWYQPDPINDPTWWAVDYDCRADYSNYGDWVSIVAPGTNIYSTLPWDKPFYLGYYYGFDSRYGYLDGTSMATPFVAAAAARRWGYLPASSNSTVGADVKASGAAITADDTCWPVTMAGVNELNVAALLNRSGIYGYIYNATTGLPLVGASFPVYQAGALRDTGVVSSIWSGYAEGINLPSGDDYYALVNATGLTAGAQPAFWHYGLQYLDPGYWGYMGRAAVPNKTGNFDVVGGWWLTSDDLDLYTWLPDTPNPLDASQPANFIVGVGGNSFGYLEGDPTGTLVGFPFAVLNREGGFNDWLPMESITISNRKAHAPLAANTSLPYYPGDYYLGLTDYGQTVGADHLMYYAYPHMYIWKDGIIKWAAYNYGCNNAWWVPFKISSGTSGTPTYTWIDVCGASGPYSVTGSTPSSGTGVLMQK